MSAVPTPRAQLLALMAAILEAGDRAAGVPREGESSTITYVECAGDLLHEAEMLARVEEWPVDGEPEAREPVFMPRAGQGDGGGA